MTLAEISLHVVLSFHQIFHWNKRVKKNSRDLSFNGIKTLKSFIQKNRLINITPKYCCGAILADFEQIINNVGTVGS